MKDIKHYHQLGTRKNPRPTVSVTNVVTQTAICPLSSFNVDVYGLECKNQPVNATLIGGRRRGTLLTALMRFTCCSNEVLQLFMTEIEYGI